jgi:homoserine dehydrogenase
MTVGCRVALLGVGTVGGGVAQLLVNEREALRSRSGGLDISLAVAADLDDGRLGPLRKLGVETTHDAASVIVRDDIDVVVELIGGTGVAREFAIRALRSGKSLVTANKALLAKAGREIFSAALAGGAHVGFSASVCGGTPVLLTLRAGLVANDISSVMGIVNGTCNYILTKMSTEGAPYATALKEAQEKGYAEADPTLDVEGQDSAHKLAILVALAFRQVVPLETIACEGIARLDRIDVRYANEMGYVVKLLAIGKRSERGVEARVHPALLPAGHPLAAVSDVFNAVEVTGHAVGRVMLSGRGAGRMPTASNVVADIIDIARGTAPRVADQLAFWAKSQPVAPLPSGETRTRFYARFTVRDEYGVLGQIARVLGEHSVSIASVIQHEHDQTSSTDEVHVVVLTHEARERDFADALATIDAFGFMAKKTVFLRLEGA